MCKTIFRLFLIVLFPFLTYSQSGKDGNVNISNLTVINEFTFITVDAPAAARILKVDNSGLNSGRFAAPLSPGDLLFIIQMQGAEIKSSDNNAWGQVLKYFNCGQYEFAEVLEVPDATTIRLACGLNHSYSKNGRTQIVRVPRYNTLNITSVLSTDPWNGRTGGLVVMEVKNATTLGTNGLIDVSGMGFRGGATGDLTSALPGTETFVEPSADFGGEKGESIAGYQNDYEKFGGRYARGAPANGGGGGNCHNAGGGGGANGGDTTSWTGDGNPDISKASYLSAWNQESPGFANTTSPGGGRGGFSFSNAQSSATVKAQTTPPGDPAWGGDGRRNVGGKGGRPLNFRSDRIFFGGGGGEGDANDNANLEGGNGGGLVYILSCGAISGTGSIKANGKKGGDSFKNNGNDGASGGGGGGTIVLNAGGSIASTLQLECKGGDGGNQQIKNLPTEAEGPGGGGGGGVILVSNGSPQILISGGKNGITNAASLSSFPANGATSGGAGSIGFILPPTNELTANDTTRCPGVATLRAINKGPGGFGNNILWYDAPNAGKLRFIGTAFKTPVLFQDTTYYVKNECPALCGAAAVAQPVHVYITPIVSDAGKPVEFCSGHFATLGAPPTTNYIYSWTPKNGLSDTTSSAPQITLTNTGSADQLYYYSVITSKKNCAGIKSDVHVTVHHLPVASAGADVNACISINQRIGSAGHAGYSYKWTPPLFLDDDTRSDPLIIAENKNPEALHLTYNLQVSDKICIYNDSIHIGLFPHVKIDTAAHNPVSCVNDSVTLVAKEGIRYKWSTGALTPQITVAPYLTSKYFVVIFNGGCSAQDSFAVIIKNNPIPEIYVPNAFSPNNDGLNDIFQAKCERLKDFHGTIFNKWGEAIYDWNTLEDGWNGNGKTEGKTAEGEVYTYLIKAIKECSRSPVYLSGTVTLTK